jgi:hypothetical protein
MLNAGSSPSSLTIGSTVRAYVAQYNSTAGTINWVTPFVATTFSCTTMSANGGGPVIAGQYTSSSAIIINSNGSFPSLSAASTTPYIYIARFNPDGTGFWGFSIPQTGTINTNLCASGCTIDAVTGLVYVCGTYQNTGSISLGGVDGSPTYTLPAAVNGDSFLIKISESGYTQWCTTVSDPTKGRVGIGGGVTTQYIGGINYVFFGGTVQPFGSTGYSFYIPDSSGSPSPKLFTGDNLQGIAFIVQYNENGSVYTARTFPRQYSTPSGITHAGLSIDSNGNLYSVINYTGNGGTFQAAY